jgi:GT2 family glycosyltransferase
MPVYQAGRYLDQTLFKLRKMDPQPDQYIFAENNSTDRTLQILTKMREPKEIIRTWYRADALNTLETEYDLIGIERELLLARARQVDPDFAVFLDSDIMVHDIDLLDRLTYWKNTVDIVGGPYLRGYAEGTYVGSLWPAPANLATPQKPFALYKKPRKYPLDDSVAAIGGGCMCLSRRVLQDRRLRFYPVKRDYPFKVSEDYGFCLDARAYGYRIGLEATVTLSHWLSPGHVKEHKAWAVNEDRKPLPFAYAAT